MADRNSIATAELTQEELTMPDQVHFPEEGRPEAKLGKRKRVTARTKIMSEADYVLAQASGKLPKRPFHYRKDRTGSVVTVN